MRWQRIPKDVQGFPVRPNLQDYETACRQFSWDDARRALSGLRGGGLNIAHEAVDRHAAGPRAHHEALRFVRADGSAHSLTYLELAGQTNRFAAVLRQLGIATVVTSPAMVDPYYPRVGFTRVGDSYVLAV